MMLFYVAHPLSGDLAGNLTRAKLWLRWLYTHKPEHGFIAPWIEIVESGALRNEIAEEHERGLRIDEEIVRRCDGIVLCGGRLSSGMERELVACRMAQGLVMDLLHLGPNPPGAA